MSNTENKEMKTPKKETKKEEKKISKKENLINANQYLTMKNIKILHRPGMLAYAKQHAKRELNKTFEQWENLFKKY